MTRNMLIGRLVARLVAAVPADRELMADGAWDDLTDTLREIADDPIAELAPDHPATATLPATVAERAMLDIVTDLVGPLWGDDGVCKAREAWLDAFDDIDAEARHYEEQAPDSHGDDGPLRRF